jgi:hypothetical protein
MTRRLHVTALALLLLAGSAAACGSEAASTRGSETAASSPSSGSGPAVPNHPPASEFVQIVDNPWMPWRPGTRWRFVGHTADGTERTVVTVTDRSKVVDGVTTTVVRDVVHLDGELLEATDDWYAQDREGNVWYFGEDTKEYDGDEVDTSGSWESGVDGAHAGIAMEASPRVGDAYWQEYLKGEAEDQARVLATDATARVPYGDLGGLLQTKDSTRLEPQADEHKFYAKGVGVVLEVSLNEKDRTELVAMTSR